jgi:hypothetical protein
MPMLDLSFPLLGPSLPTDHGYELYAALCWLLPALPTTGFAASRKAR